MQVDSISVVPIIGKNAGLEAKEPVDLIKRDSDGNRILEPINGLISWWKLNGDMKDSFGNNNGNCSGNYCPSYGEDRNGNPNGAGVFDGINDDIFIARSSSTDTLTKNGTISVWIKARSLSGIAPVNSIYSGICSVVDWASTGAGGFILYVYNDTMPLRRKVVAHFGSGNTPNSKYALSKTVLDYDSWYNLVMVFDHDKGYIYVNGSLEDYANIPGGDTLALTLVKHIGSHSGTIRFFNGSIDDVIVFNRPLTAEEIKGIYNMQK